MNRLQEKYQQEIVPQLVKEFSLDNAMAAAAVRKIVVNMGVSQPQEPRQRWQIMDGIVEQFKVITGQKPAITLAKKSVANFKLREGDPLGVMVTLRGQKMWEFLDKLINITLPREKDFRGISKTAFDQKANYNLGIREQIVFPEIEYDKIDRIRGLQVTICTSNDAQAEAFRLLELLGMPFEKEEETK